jgi:hypothetical protein
MDYFVSIENTPYYHWQIELLIESFKHQGCQDKLFVAVAEGRTHEFNLTRNLYSHPRVYQHENIGQIRGYAPLNALGALAFSIRNGILKQPLAIIPPDVVLYREANMSFEGFPEVVFYPDPFFTLEIAEEEIGPFWEWLGKSRKDFESGWVPLGSLMIFANIPTELFYEAIRLTELLATHQLLAEKTISDKTHILAWIILLMRFSSRIRVFGDYMLAMPLLGSGDSPFISYKHGMPPAFNKSMFLYAPPHYSSFGNPFNVLATNYPSPNAYYLSQLARKHLDSKP